MFWLAISAVVVYHPTKLLESAFKSDTIIKPNYGSLFKIIEGSSRNLILTCCNIVAFPAMR